MTVTHEGKALSYAAGRPDYPKHFFDFLTSKLSLNGDSVMVDMGCGTGTITAEFAARFGAVYGIEPDRAMLSVAEERLKDCKNAILIPREAENSGLSSHIADCIFCGNSYHWFNRQVVSKEFCRIAKPNAKVVIASFGPGNNPYDEELRRLYGTAAPSPVGAKRTSPFLEGTAEKSQWNVTVLQNFDAFFSGISSASYAPKPDNRDYLPFQENCRRLFDRYEQKGVISTMMLLTAEYGAPKDLAAK